MNRINQSMLEYWFANLDKKIDSYDADIVVAETQLRALKSSAKKTKHHQFKDVPGKPDWVRIECAGGCGRHVELRKKKVDFASYYVCNSVLSGRRCKESLPSPEPRQISSISFNCAGSFTGITYEWPTPAEQASLNRARGILASGVTSMLIENVRKRP